MKNTYLIKKFDCECCVDWSEVTSLEIGNCLWDKTGYAPVSRGQFCYTDSGIFVKLTSYEGEILGRYENMNEPVYTDSCLEFFFKINPDTDARYLNFETNCIGTLLLGFGDVRDDRKQLDFDFRNVLKMKSSVTKDSIADYDGTCWSVEYQIPFSFLQSLYGELDIKSGKRIEANVFKCGDDTKFEHYLSWNNVLSEVPNFHSPEFFGEMIFE